VAYKKLRVLLVDMDFFAPKLSGMLQRTDSRGLSDLLAGGCNLEGVLQETRVPSLWFTAAGTVKERRDLLYDDPALTAFLQEVRQRFDVVIVDTPAALFVPEVVGVMEHMDGIILMVRLEVTSRVALDKLKGLLQSHNLPVLGAIINGVKENVLNKYTGYHAERYRYYPDGEADRASGALVPAPALVADTALVVDTALVADSAAHQWLDTVVVEAGTRLTLLSLSYYGDKVFWVYLYIANRDVIKDPNRVPTGASLRIPMPDRYRIDAADKESVARAAKLQREILAGNFEGVDALDKLTVL